MAKVSDQSSVALEQYFSQGLSGITKRNQTQIDDFKTAFQKDNLLNAPNVDLYAKKTVNELLKHDVLDNYVIDMLKEQFVTDDGHISQSEYPEVMESLSAALKKEAKRYPAESDENRVFTMAAKLAHQLETDRLQFKRGRDALVSA